MLSPAPGGGDDLGDLHPPDPGPTGELDPHRQLRRHGRVQRFERAQRPGNWQAQASFAGGATHQASTSAARQNTVNP
ncbi:MAG: hypothetical protein ABI355_08285 [Solirubrobacteraceae bacterium]